MPEHPPPPRWSVERRLGFIASRLTWEGRINRTDLVARFGVSPNQATADLRQFETLHPGSLAYDPRVKTYRAGPGLAAPTPPAANDLLRELRLIAEGVLSPEEATLAYPPTAETAEPPARAAAADVLAVVLAAIRERRGLSAIYRSFTSPDAGRRPLEPHALVFDGFRWHARAKDVEAKRFKDFVLGRLSEPELCGSATGTSEDDSEWNARVELRIAPHPGLAPHQKEAIVADYDMRDGYLALRPRLAVTFYLKRRLGLLEGHQSRPPEDQHIVLVSEAEVEPEA